jgi:hypothetical protein
MPSGQRKTGNISMAELNYTIDPTLDAVDRAIEQAQSKDMRPYLGMSSIGKPCERALWLNFRWAKEPSFKAQTIKRFEDGHSGEDLQAKRLKMVEGITLTVLDEATGNQYGFTSIGGHLKGHMDGAILGLLQAPKTWHVWEHKQVDQKKFDKLNKLKMEVGEKNALQHWDEIYYAQAICYMGFTGMARHYLTCATPGGRDTTSVRTDADPDKFEVIIGKAERIIRSSEPPPRISSDSTYYICKMCEFHGLCHGTTAPIPTCRSCCHSTPELDGNGRWFCTRHKMDLTIEDQKSGCQGHLIVPQIMDRWAEVLDASLAENWIMYRHRETEAEFRNGLDGSCFQSLEIHSVEDKKALTDETVGEIRKVFDGRIVG